MFTFRPMETIPESRSTPDSPGPDHHHQPTETSLETFLHALSKQTEIMNKPTASPADASLARSRSTPPNKILHLRNPSQRVREWMLKRSNSTRSPKDEPPSSPPPILEIAHLGGARLGDEEIAQMHAAAGITALIQPPAPLASASNSTNPRPARPAAASNETRVTQWIDLYPECLETFAVEPSPHWQPQPQPQAQVNPHPKPLSTPAPPRPLPPRDSEGLVRPKTAPSSGRAINAFPVELDATSSLALDPSMPQAGGNLRPPPLRTVGSKSGLVKRKPSREDMGRLRLDTGMKGAVPAGTGGGSAGGRKRSGSANAGSSPTSRGKSPSSGSGKTASSSSSSNSKPSKTSTTKPTTSTSPPSTTTTKQSPAPETNHHHRSPSDPTKWRTKPLPSIPTPPGTAATSVHTVPEQDSTPSDPEDLTIAPPTPDSDAGGMARVIHTAPPAKEPITTSFLELDVGLDSPTQGRGDLQTPRGIPPATGPPKYTRPELIWLHRNYRGELPFLRAWGLDISSAEDRAEGLEMLRELMQEEREMGLTTPGKFGGHERSVSKDSLTGSCTGEIEVGFQGEELGEGMGRYELS